MDLKSIEQWQAVLGLLSAFGGIVVLIWRASMTAVFKNTDLVVGQAAVLREENDKLRKERDAYRAQLIAAGIEPNGT